MTNCLENLIGISNSDCHCLSDEFKDRAKESKTGIFLDQLQGLPPVVLLNAMNNDECNDTLTMMFDAVQEATDIVSSAFNEGINERWDKRFKRTIGEYGYRDKNSTEYNDFEEIGLEIECYKIIGGTLNITDISVRTKYLHSDLAVNIARRTGDGRQDYESIATIGPIISGPSWTGNNIADPLVLEMTDEKGRPYVYNLLLPKFSNSGVEVIPLVNSCMPNKGNCTPCQKRANNSSAMPNGFANVSGFTSIGLPYEDNRALLNNCAGIVIGIQFNCDGMKHICRERENDDRFKKQLGYTIRFLAGSILLNKIFSSGKINRFTMLNQDLSYKMIEYFNSEYSVGLDSLVKSADYDLSGCYKCKKGIGFSGIYA